MKWRFQGKHLAEFLLKCVKLRSREKFPKSNTKAIADHLNSNKLWILAFTVQYVLNAGRRKRRNSCQLIDADFMLPTQL